MTQPRGPLQAPPCLLEYVRKYQKHLDTLNDAERERLFLETMRAGSTMRTPCYPKEPAVG